MFCINCGKQLEEGSRFCPYCGAKVPDVTASAPAEPGNPAGQPGQPDPGASNPFQQQNPASGETGGDPGQTGSWNQFAGSDPGQSGTGYQSQSGTGYWGQSSGTNPDQTGTGYQGQAYGGNQSFNQNQNQNKGGFDPWSMKGGPSQTGGPVQGDPWGTQGGVATATKPPKKKHTVRNVILIVVGVIVLALVGLFILGSTELGKYEPVIESYLSYAEEGDTQRVESLFYPAVVESYGMWSSQSDGSDVLFYLDSWTDNYGQTVDRYEIAEIDDEEDELAYFNDAYGVKATEYVDVTVDVYYDNGRYSCIDFDMVKVDGSWYLAYIW